MRTTTLSWITAPARGLLAPTLPDFATAADPARPSPAFQQLDANGDGQLQRAESKSCGDLHNGFDAADADGSGSLSVREFAAFESQGHTRQLPGRKPTEIWFTVPAHQPE